MKRFILLCVAILFAEMLYAQTSMGEFVVFPDKKAAGSYYKPRLTFARINGEDYVVLRIVRPDTYATFDKGSRVLLKFEDDSTVKFPIITELDIIKDFDSMYLSMLHTTAKFYITASFYSIDDETLKLITENKKKIVKIRVVRSNGDIDDYEITNKYQEEFITKLQASYIALENEDNQRKANMSDEDF